MQHSLHLPLQVEMQCGTQLLRVLGCGLKARTAGTAGRLTAAAAPAAALAAWWPALRLAAASSASGSAAAWALSMLLAGAEVGFRAWRGRAGDDGQRARALRGAAHMVRSAHAPPRRAADAAQAEPASARARPAADAQHEPEVRSAPRASARFDLLHRAHTCEPLDLSVGLLGENIRKLQSKRLCRSPHGAQAQVTCAACPPLDAAPAGTAADARAAPGRSPHARQPPAPPARPGG